MTDPVSYVGGRSLGRDIKGGVSVSLSVDLVEALNAFCRARGLRRSAAVEVALRRFLLDEREKAGG